MHVVRNNDSFWALSTKAGKSNKKQKWFSCANVGENPLLRKNKIKTALSEGANVIIPLT